MGKKNRIGLKKLFASRETGGLALPNVELYNVAFEMNKLVKHWEASNSNLKWVEMEEALAYPSGVVEFLSQKAQAGKGNLILKHAQWAWARAHKMLRISQYKQSYSSIWNNPLICIGNKEFLWQTWLAKGIRIVQDLYRDQLFMSFEDLKEQFNLTDKGDFWRYLQLRGAVRSVFGLCNTCTTCIALCICIL